MDKKKLEIKDAVIPPVVRNKIDLAYLQIQSEQEKKMKTISISRAYKRIIAVVACAALCVCGGYAYDAFKISSNEGHLDDVTGSAEETSHTNPFTLKVLAAELNKETPQPISVSGAISPSWALSGHEADYSISYVINFPLSCEGENIESVTYSINKGFFQLIEATDDIYVIDQTAYEGDTAQIGLVGGFVDEENSGESVRPSNLYHSTGYTVAYDKQAGDWFRSNVCGECSNMEAAFHLIWDSGSDEDYAKALNLLLEGIEITVTTNYVDGSSSSETLGLEAQIVDIEPWETNEGIIVDKEVQIFVKLL